MNATTIYTIAEQHTTTDPEAAFRATREGKRVTAEVRA